MQECMISKLMLQCNGQAFVCVIHWEYWLNIACLVWTEIYQLCFSFKRLAALLNLLLLKPDPAAAPRTHMALLTLRALVVMSAEQHKAINWYKFRPTNQSRGFQTLDTLQGEWKFKLAVATLNNTCADMIQCWLYQSQWFLFVML